MAEAGAPWQLEFEKMEQRCGYLLTSGQWSDCIFMVDSVTNQEVVQAHKLVLAMASPVFEAMFYGRLSESNEPIVPIPDISPEAFKALLQYIYTGNIDIGSFDIALDVLYGAKKYMLPHLVKKCKDYILSVLAPENACRAYEFARLFEEKTIMDRSIEIISTKTKEVLKDSSFNDVELNTVITVFALEHLNVDSELDLFYAVSRYAKAGQRMKRQNSPPEGGRPVAESLSESVQRLAISDEEVLLSIENSSQTSPEAEQDTKSPNDTSVPTSEKETLKEEVPTIRTAIEKIRFLSLSPAEFAEGPALSDLLTKDESFAVLMNMVSTASAVPMPTGFSEHRDGRHQRSHSKNQCYNTDSLDQTINGLKCGIPSQVEAAAWAAAHILRTTYYIQTALDEGILDALVPALTEGNEKCKLYAALAIRFMCARARLSSQLGLLAVSAALQPYCRLLAAGGMTCGYVLSGLLDALQKVDPYNKPTLLRKLREFGVPQLLLALEEGEDEWNRDIAGLLIEKFFQKNQ